MISKELEARRELLRKDYERVKGVAFRHFSCPILFVDEDVELCKGHIVNKAFPNSARSWTVQRKDVDNFYGLLEADFLDIKYINQTEEEMFSDLTVWKNFRPKFLLENQPISYYFSESEPPKNFTAVSVNSGKNTFLVNFKMSETQLRSSIVEEQNWEIALFKDLRIQTLVSLIKGAHLTLFSLLGYRYSTSLASDFIGKKLLGNFFLSNQGKEKEEIIEAARRDFAEYIHLIQYIKDSDFDFQGTITDKIFALCRGFDNRYWASIVFVRTNDILHSVMLPLFGEAEAVATFLDFMNNKNEDIQVNFCRYDTVNDRLEIDPMICPLTWPKSGTLA